MPKNKEKKYSPKEIAGKLASTLKEEIKKAEKPKTYSATEVVQKIQQTLQIEIDKIKKNTLTQYVRDNASNPNSSPAKPTERQYQLTGCEPTFLDAVEHHAFHAAARFHEGNDKKAIDHLSLAKAHASVAGVDPKNMIEFAYGLTEDIEPITEVFGDKVVTHPMDKELSKALKERKGTYPKGWEGSKKRTMSGTDEIEIASGKVVDAEHIGDTPDDRPIKEVGDDHAQDAKIKKEEDEECLECGKEPCECEQEDDEMDEEVADEAMEKEFESGDIRAIRDQKGYTKPKKIKTPAIKTELDGKGSSGGCNAVMNKKGKK